MNVRRILLTAGCCLLIILFAPSANAAAKPGVTDAQLAEAIKAANRCMVHDFKVRPFMVSKMRPVGQAYRRWVLHKWQVRLAVCKLLAAETKELRTLASSERGEAMRWYYASGAECVKDHEGAWTSNTGNGYYGGFQADQSFQQAYGAEFYRLFGTANNWKPWQQIVMAHRGWKARGWNPWPTTSRMCGLR